MIVPCSRYFVNQERPFLDKLNSNFSLLSSSTFLIEDPGSFIFSFVRIRILDAGFRPRPLFCSGGISCRLPSAYLPLFRSRAIPWRCPFLCRLCRRHEMPPLQLHNDTGFPLKTCGNDRRREGLARGAAPPAGAMRWRQKLARSSCPSPSGRGQGEGNLDGLSGPHEMPPLQRRRGAAPPAGARSWRCLKTP